VITAGSGPARPGARLTDLTDCGGCAAKLGADVLAEVLAGLGAISGPAPAGLIAGLDPPDDAAVHRLTDELAVMGVAHPDRLLRKCGARPGDVLLLTKPLGTGLLVSGARQGWTSAGDPPTAVASMRTLNRAAAEVFVAHDVRGATDVTGFGL
jgi:selenide,water dikinase